MVRTSVWRPCILGSDQFVGHVCAGVRRLSTNRNWTAGSHAWLAHRRWHKYYNYKARSFNPIKVLAWTVALIQMAMLVKFRLVYTLDVVLALINCLQVWSA